MITTNIIRDRSGQSVRLPPEFHFRGKQVLINRMGPAVVLFPKGASWGSYLRSLPHVSEDFMKDRASPKRSARRKAK